MCNRERLEYLKITGQVLHVEHSMYNSMNASENIMNCAVLTFTTVLVTKSNYVHAIKTNSPTRCRVASSEYKREVFSAPADTLGHYLNIG